jgi:hypothetical protein
MKNSSVVVYVKYVRGRGVGDEVSRSMCKRERRKEGRKEEEEER